MIKVGDVVKVRDPNLGILVGKVTEVEPRNLFGEFSFEYMVDGEYRFSHQRHILEVGDHIIQDHTQPVKYDPQQSYFDRMNSTQRANHVRRQQHQFADSIGGCSSNYR